MTERTALLSRAREQLRNARAAAEQLRALGFVQLAQAWEAYWLACALDSRERAREADAMGQESRAEGMRAAACALEQEVERVR